MVEFTYIKNHGTYKKGDVRKMPESTAKQLEAHKVGKVGSIIPEVMKKKVSTGKAGPIKKKK